MVSRLNGWDSTVESVGDLVSSDACKNIGQDQADQSCKQSGNQNHDGQLNQRDPLLLETFMANRRASLWFSAQSVAAQSIHLSVLHFSFLGV